MALAQLIIQAPGGPIKSGDWNNEFQNILTHPIALISPSTGAINFNFQLHTNLLPSAITASSAGTGSQILGVSSSGGTATFLPSGPRVLQVVSGNNTGPVTATTTSFVDTTIGISLTPASTNSRIAILYSVLGNVGVIVGANPIYQAQIATSSGSIPVTVQAITAPVNGGGSGVTAVFSWSILTPASTGPYPTTYDIQHLETTLGTNPSLTNFQGMLVEYSS